MISNPIILGARIRNRAPHKAFFPLLFALFGTTACNSVTGGNLPSPSNSGHTAFRKDVTESALNNPVFQNDWKTGCHTAVDAVKIGAQVSFASINSQKPVYTEPLTVTSKKQLRAVCNRTPQIEPDTGATNPCIAWEMDSQNVIPYTLYMSAVETNDANQLCAETLKSLVSGLEKTGGHFVALGATNANNFNAWMRDVLKDHDDAVSFCSASEIGDVFACTKQAASSVKTNIQKQGG